MPGLHNRFQNPIPCLFKSTVKLFYPLKVKAHPRNKSHPAPESPFRQCPGGPPGPTPDRAVLPRGVPHPPRAPGHRPPPPRRPPDPLSHPAGFTGPEKTSARCLTSTRGLGLFDNPQPRRLGRLHRTFPLPGKLPPSASSQGVLSDRTCHPPPEVVRGFVSDRSCHVTISRRRGGGGWSPTVTATARRPHHWTPLAPTRSRGRRCPTAHSWPTSRTSTTSTATRPTPRGILRPLGPAPTNGHGMRLKIGVAPTDIFWGLASVYPKFLPNSERVIAPNWFDNCYLFNLTFSLKMANLDAGGVAPQQTAFPAPGPPPGGCR